MNFCSNCGAPVRLYIPPGDNLPRHVCDACRIVHYQNPKLVVGCIPEWEDKILLCRRAINPRYGLWTVPAGFMENGETTAQAAAREALEEACARVEITGLYALFNLPHINQVYLIFRSRLLDMDCMPGSESLEVGMFYEHEIPWSQLAFATVRESLRLFFEDRRTGIYPVHVKDIEPPPLPRPPAREGMREGAQADPQERVSEPDVPAAKG
jgi:ADP-ribose pyrophosphatase YjhB (NUDIX family)